MLGLKMPTIEMMDQIAAPKTEKIRAGILTSFAASTVSNGYQKNALKDGLSLSIYIIPVASNAAPE